MAITFVGSHVGTHAATSAQTVNFSSLLNAAGGTPTLLQNDIVVVTYVHSMATLGNRTLAQCTPAGYTAAHAAIIGNASESNSVSMAVSYKFMGATPDTSVAIPAAAATTNGVGYAIYVFRGVDTTTPLDATTTTASAINGGVANAPAITPVSAGAWIAACGGAAVAAGAVFTNPTGLSATTNHFRSATITTTTNDANVGVGLKTDWASGAFDPAAFGGSTTTNTGSWGAATFALRPVQSIALVVQSDTSASLTTSPTLAPMTALTVGAATSTSTTDTPTLSPMTALTVGNATSTSVTDTPTLGAKTQLVLNDVVSQSVVTTPTLAPKTALTVAGAVTKTYSGGPIGAEMVTNGTFTTDTSGWTAQNGAVLTLSNGGMRVTASTGGYAPARSTLITNAIIGRTYLFSSTGDQGTSITAATGVDVGSAAGTANYVSVLNSNINQTFVATTVNVGISLWAGNVAGMWSEYDNISVRELALDVVLAADVAHIAPNSATSASLAGTPTLVPKTALVVADAVSASLTDNPTLTPKTVLTVAAATSVSLTTAPTLAPKTVLTVAAVTSASLTDSPTITPKTAITVASATSATLTTSPVLAPKTTITVAGAVSASLTTSLVLNSGLAISSSVSTSLADQVTLVPKTALAMAGATSASTTSSPTVTPRTSLLVSSALSSTLTSSPTLTPKTSLLVNGSVSATSTSSPTLESTMLPQSALSLSTVGAPTLVFKIQVVPANVNSASTASNARVIPGVVTPTPQKRWKSVAGGLSADRGASPSAGGAREAAVSGGGNNRSAGIS